MPALDRRLSIRPRKISGVSARRIVTEYHPSLRTHTLPSLAHSFFRRPGITRTLSASRLPLRTAAFAFVGTRKLLGKARNRDTVTLTHGQWWDSLIVSAIITNESIGRRDLEETLLPPHGNCESIQIIAHARVSDIIR